MSSEEVPEDVCAFLRDLVESYEELEILLLLYRERPKKWTEEQLRVQSRVPASLLAAALSALTAKQLVESSSGPVESLYGMGPATPALEPTLSRLAALYTSRPIDIIKLMSANAIERVRTAALRTFVDAFVLRKR